MYEICPAHIRMIRVILQDGYFDENTYECQVVTYNSEKECIYLIVGENELPGFSLDGVYECVIRSEKEEIKCHGIIKERFLNELGRIVVLNVINGFYKNSVN